MTETPKFKLSVTVTHFFDKDHVEETACNTPYSIHGYSTSDPKKVTCKNCRRTREYQNALKQIKE